MKKLKLDNVLDIEIKIPHGSKITLLGLVTEIGPKKRIQVVPQGAINLDDPPKKERTITAKLISADMEAIETTLRFDAFRTFKEGIYSFKYGIWFHDGDYCNLDFSMHLPKKKKKREHAIEAAIRKYLNKYTGEIKFE